MYYHSFLMKSTLKGCLPKHLQIYTGGAEGIHSLDSYTIEQSSWFRLCNEPIELMRENYSLSKYGALARKLASVSSFNRIVFLIGFNFVSVSHFLTFGYLIPEGHFVLFWAYLYQIPVSVPANIYLDISCNQCLFILLRIIWNLPKTSFPLLSFVALAMAS